MMQSKGATELLMLASWHGWAVAYVPGVDTGGNPFVTVQGQRDGVPFDATWHTRPTGGKSYRLTNCTHARRTVSLSRLKEAIEEPTDARS